MTKHSKKRDSANAKLCSNFYQRKTLNILNKELLKKFLKEFAPISLTNKTKIKAIKLILNKPNFLMSQNN